MIISGRSEILDFGTIPVFSRKLSTSATESRESATFIIFIFSSKRNIFSFQYLFLFSFFFFFPSFSFHFLLQPSTIFFSTSPSPPHHLPPSSSPPHPLTWQAPIGQEKHLILHFANSPLSFIYLHHLHNSKSYKYLSFSISLHFFSSPKP